MPPKKSNNAQSRRYHTYKLLINDLPPIAVLLAFIIFFLTVTGSIVLIWFAPSATIVSARKLTDLSAAGGISEVDVLKGDAPFIALSDKLTKAHQEITFSIFFKPSAYVSGIVKEDVELNVIIEGTNDKEDTYEFKWTDNHLRTLTCDASPSSTVNIGNVINFQTKGSYFCNPIIAFRDRYIQYERYRIGVTFNNLDKLYEHGLLDDIIEAKWEYSNPQYTVFETVFRAQFFILAMVLVLFYVIFLFSKQSWSHSKTEQKWIIVVLVALTWYNNPLFIADWLADNWVFPLVNIVCISTFIAVLSLFIMVVTHAVVVKPKERTFWWFYLPKLAVVLVNWLLVVLILGWERFNQSTDPAYEVTEIPFFGEIRIAVIAITSLTVIMIGYYVFRAIADINNMSQNYGMRFKYFWLLTGLVMLATGVDFVTMMLADYANSAAQSLSFFPLYNFYCVALAIFYLPSNTVEEDAQELAATGLFFEEEDEMRDLERGKKRGKVVDALADDDDDDVPVQGKGKQPARAAPVPAVQESETQQAEQIQEAPAS